MIGYYVHHQGTGHLHRAAAVAEAWTRTMAEEVVGLSSLPRPAAWRGRWFVLERDDASLRPDDPTAGEQLHWVPLGEEGLRHRMAAMSHWMGREAPRALVVDVSVEVLMLARLHGVPTVAVVLPGRRTDAAHLTAFRAACALVAAWPEGDGVEPTMTPDLPPDVTARLHSVGAISRFGPGLAAAARVGAGADRRVALLQGAGGGAICDLVEADLATRTPGWRWTVLGPGHNWVVDPTPVLRAADVVVCTAGQGALADVAALRRPAVVLPLPRPYDEQACTARALSRGRWPAVVVDTPEQALDSAVLDRAARLDGARWQAWCDGQGARRFAEVIGAVALPRRGPSEPAVPA